MVAINCKEGEQVTGDQVLAVIEGVEEIEELDEQGQGQAGRRSRSSAGQGQNTSDASMDVWRSEECSVEDFLEGQQLRGSVIRNLPRAQLEDAKAQAKRERNLALKSELQNKLEQVENRMMPRHCVSWLTSWA